MRFTATAAVGKVDAVAVRQPGRRTAQLRREVIVYRWLPRITSVTGLRRRNQATYRREPVERAEGAGGVSGELPQPDLAGTQVSDRLAVLMAADRESLSAHDRQFGLAGAVLVDLLMLGRVHVITGSVAITDPVDLRLTGDTVLDEAMAVLRAEGTTGTAGPLPDSWPPSWSPCVGLRQAVAVVADVLPWDAATPLVDVGHSTTTADGLSVAAVRASIRKAAEGQDVGVDVDALCVLVRVPHLHRMLQLGAVDEVDDLLSGASRRLCHRATRVCATS